MTHIKDLLKIDEDTRLNYLTRSVASMMRITFSFPVSRRISASVGTTALFLFEREKNNVYITLNRLRKLDDKFIQSYSLIFFAISGLKLSNHRQNMS